MKGLSTQKNDSRWDTTVSLYSFHLIGYWSAMWVVKMSVLNPLPHFPLYTTLWGLLSFVLLSAFSLPNAEQNGQMTDKFFSVLASLVETVSPQGWSHDYATSVNLSLIFFAGVRTVLVLTQFLSDWCDVVDELDCGSISLRKFNGVWIELNLTAFSIEICSRRRMCRRFIYIISFWVIVYESFMIDKQLWSMNSFIKRLDLIIVWLFEI